MSRAYSDKVLALAALHKIPASDLPLIINGCSGGFSRFYWLAFGRAASCEHCCDLHDLRYQLGGDAANRAKADAELRRCAIESGKPVPGWLSAMRGQFPKTALLFIWLPLLRRIFRWLRAWAMFGAVRAFGKRYWGR